MNKKINIYHGSSHIIEEPVWGYGKDYNDYGLGLYCTENSELAKEWACTENIDGFSNQYEIDLSGMDILDLSSKEYCILHWITLLVLNRKFRLSTPVMRRAVDWLSDNFYINADNYDIIIGYRADDSYFSFARAFLSNEITIQQLSVAMKLGKLGEQVVIKSKDAFEKLKFISYETVDSNIYYPKRKYRDDEARSNYLKTIEELDMDGLYLSDIIRERMKSDDERLRY